MKNRYFKKHNQANKISDDVMVNGILIGCHHGLTKQEINYMLSVMKKFIEKFI